MVETTPRDAATARAAAAEDARERDRAVTDDEALVAYERKWTARIARLQRAHPARWHVPGFSDDELRDELGLRLIDAVRTSPEARARHAEPDREWGLSFVVEQLRALRRERRLRVVLTDHGAALERAERFGQAPSVEEALVAEASARALVVARERAEHGLTRPQRRWLEAMKTTAEAGAFFASSGELNLAAVSRVLDKDRSSAQRALAGLRRHFARERGKAEG